MILADEAAARRWLADDLGIDAQAMDRLERLSALLQEENRRQNLVAETSLDAVWTRHFADSAQLLRFVPRETPNGPWLDLGTGAGFPGLVVAVCRPDWPVTLVESRTRRVAWLEFVIAELGLGATVRGERLEVVETLAARIISARAFAPLAKLIALSARFSTPQTVWLLPKGRSGRQELAEMPGEVQKMFHVEHSLTGADSVILVGQGRASTRRTRK